MVEMLQQLLDAPVPAIAGVGQPLGEEREDRAPTQLITPHERAERPRHTRIADSRQMRLQIGDGVGAEGRLGEPLDHHGAAHDHGLIGLVDADGALALELPHRAQPHQLETGIECLPGGERGHERRRCPVAGSGTAPARALAHQGGERQTSERARGYHHGEAPLAGGPKRHRDQGAGARERHPPIAVDGRVLGRRPRLQEGFEQRHECGTMAVGARRRTVRQAPHDSGT